MRRPLRTDSAYIEEVKDFYRHIEDYDWNTVVDGWQGPEALLHRARERRLVALVAQYGYGSAYLDVGCGTGLILRHLLAGSVGIDINPRHAQRAQRYAPHTHVQVGDIDTLPFRDASFSTVICTEVLEHLVHPGRGLEEIERVLEPRGVLIGSTPRHSLLWRLRWLSSTHYGNEPFHNEFTANEMTQLLRRWHVKYLRPHVARAIFFFVAQKI